MENKYQDKYLMIRVNNIQKQKARIVARSKGIPNISIFIRELIEEKIEEYENQHGTIKIETRNNQEE